MYWLVSSRLEAGELPADADDDGAEKCRAGIPFS